MKRYMLIAFLAAFATATTTTAVTKVMGFGSHAYAANDDSQGDDDDQGEDGQ